MTDWSTVPWTPFREAVIPSEWDGLASAPLAIFLNSRYQVSIFPVHECGFGEMVHLSIKTLDKQAHHDWRDFQRIKNELCGPGYDAVEIYPDEAKLVDSANQYHLYVFRTFKLPFGFQERLVADGSFGNSLQRPFDERPADCLDAAAFAQRLRDAGVGVTTDGHDA